MDKYESARSLPFSLVAEALGIDVSRFKVRKQGREYYGPCPVHDSKHNTTCFSYNVDGRWNCFSCQGKGKGAIDLCKAVLNVGFQAAVERLTPLLAIQPEMKKEPPRGDSECSGESELKPYTGTYHKFAVPCPWLEARVPDPAIRKRYGLFCYENPKRKSSFSGRVMIPVKDTDGVLYGYLGRSITAQDNQPDGQPAKYLFPAAFPKQKFLFGANVLKAGMFGPLPLRKVWVVESPFAVCHFASLGLPAVSPYGWSVSAQQIDCLCALSKGVVYIPDRNKALDSQSQVASIAAKLWIRAPELPPGVDDPEQLTREQILGL